MRIKKIAVFLWLGLVSCVFALERVDLPDGAWKCDATGTLTVQQDGLLHDELQNKVICLTGDGLAINEAKQYGDFLYAVKLRPTTERYWWDDKAVFRIQKEDKNKFYFVQRVRSGKIVFGVQTARRSSKILASSIREFPIAGVLYLKIEVEGNHFVIYASNNALDYLKVIDEIDTDSTFAKGYCGFYGRVHTHFTTCIEPWGDDLQRKENGAWIVALRPTKGFVADNNRPVEVCLEAVLFSMSEGERGDYSLRAGGVTVPVEALHVGFNATKLSVPVEAGAKDISIPVTLLKKKSKSAILGRLLGDTELETVTVKLSDPVKQGTPSLLGAPFNELKQGAVQKNDYLNYLNEIYLGMSFAERSTTKVSWSGILPVLYTEMYEATGDESYLQDLKVLMKGWDDAYASQKTLPGETFTDRGPFVKSVLLLLAKGNLTAEEQAKLKFFCSEILVKGIYEGGGCMNRPLGYQLGLRQILTLLPEHPLRDEIKQYIENQEISITQNLEELENSANYEGITVFYLIQWIELNGRQDLYQNPKLKNTLERMLAMQSPMGGMIAFGDYGNVDNEDPLLPAVFEKAASVYHDGRYKTAAKKMFERLLAKNPERSGHLLWGISSAYLWADDTVAATEIPKTSKVTYRNNGDADKVILQNEHSYVLFDMINGREHGDNNTLGLMAYITDGKYRLFDQGGRLPDSHSKPMIEDQEKNFPFKTRRMEMCNPADPGRWAIAELYLKNHWSWMNFSGGAGGPTQYNGIFESDRHTDIPYEFTYYPKNEFTLLANFIGTGKNKVLIDDVKLIDAAGNEKILADFEENTWGWRGNVERVSGGFESGHCAQFSLDLDAGFNTLGRIFQMPLDVDTGKWTKVSFRYKLAEPASSDFMLQRVTVGDIRGYPRNYLFHHNPMFVGKVEPLVADKNYVKMRLDEKDLYGRPQSKVREVMLRTDNSLLIRDAFEIQEARPYACGPVYQIEQLVQRGENWFETAADGRLLIWFAPVKGAVCGTGAAPKSESAQNRINQTAVYQKAVGFAPNAVTCVTALAPLNECDDAAAVAEKLNAEWIQGKMIFPGDLK